MGYRHQWDDRFIIGTVSKLYTISIAVERGLRVVVDDASLPQDGGLGGDPTLAMFISRGEAI